MDTRLGIVADRLDVVNATKLGRHCVGFEGVTREFIRRQTVVGHSAEGVHHVLLQLGEVHSGLEFDLRTIETFV